MAKNPDYTPEERAYIMEYYPQLPAAEIAAHLGRSVNGVRGAFNKWKMRDETLCVKKARRQWSDEQLEMLLESWGQVPDEEVAALIGRPLSSCRSKAFFLRHARRQNMFTANEVVGILGTSHKSVRQWIKRRWLSARRADFGMPDRRPWRISVEALEGFMTRHPDKYNYWRIDREQYPYWRNLAERIAKKRGVTHTKVFRRREWTPQEEAGLLRIWGRAGKLERTWLAHRLGRTYSACATRFRRAAKQLQQCAAKEAA